MSPGLESLEETHKGGEVPQVSALGRKGLWAEWAPQLSCELLAALALPRRCPRRRQRGPSRSLPGRTWILFSSRLSLRAPRWPGDTRRISSSCSHTSPLPPTAVLRALHQEGDPLGYLPSGAGPGRLNGRKGMQSRAQRQWYPGGCVQEMGATSGASQVLFRGPESLGVRDAGGGTLGQ